MSAQRIVFLLSLGLLALSLAACVAPTPAPPAPAPPSVEPAKPPAAPTAAAATLEVPAAPTAAPIAADDAWSRIQKSGVIRVGSPLDNPPFNLRNDEFQPDGFDVALMNELATRLGLKAQFDDYGFDGLLGALQLDQIDAAIAAMAITPARQEVADFTSAYYVGEDIVLAAVDSPITQIADAADVAMRRVGVQRGTVYETWLLNNLVATKLMPRENVKAYASPADAVAALGKGQVDLVVMDREPGLSVASEGKAKEVGKSLYQQDYAIAVPKGSSLAPQLNRALAKLLVDGTVARLAEQYLRIPADQFTPAPPPPTEAPAPTAAPTPQPTPTRAPYDDMAYVDDLSYDDTNGAPVVQPGQAIKKGWRIRNSGTTTWSRITSWRMPRGALIRGADGREAGADGEAGRARGDHRHLCRSHRASNARDVPGVVADEERGRPGLRQADLGEGAGAGAAAAAHSHPVDRHLVLGRQEPVGRGRVHLPPLARDQCQGRLPVPARPGVPRRGRRGGREGVSAVGYGDLPAERGETGRQDRVGVPDVPGGGAGEHGQHRELRRRSAEHPPRRRGEPVVAPAGQPGPGGAAAERRAAGRLGAGGQLLRPAAGQQPAGRV